MQAQQQMMNPVMLQQQIMQGMMMLSNPQLPPPARMQITFQLQQAQMLMANMMKGQELAQQQQYNQGGTRRPRASPFFPDQPAGKFVGINACR